MPIQLNDLIQENMKADSTTMEASTDVEINKPTDDRTLENNNKLPNDINNKSSVDNANVLNKNLEYKIVADEEYIPDEVKHMNDKNSQDCVYSGTRLQNFYHGKNIFITGATGFLGKMLVEKLLRSCPGVDTLYLLVRQKKGKDSFTRIDEIFDDPVFSVLKLELPKFRHKVRVVSGDCAAAGLGLSLPDRQTLVEKVNIIFHAAATVKFDEKLRTALAINVAAPLHIISLAKDMRNLQAIMHISTAYSNCHLDRIEERIYDFPAKLESVDQLVDKMNDQEIDRVLPTILGPWPNTYTFTKALAEYEVKKNSGDLPLSVFRPAIVTSTTKEPFPAWIDNMYGPTGVVAGAATGMLRSLHCDPDSTAEIVPVDSVVNCLLAAAEHTARTKRDNSAELTVYNYVSSVENRITWLAFMTLICRYSFGYPLSSAVWYRSLTLHKSGTMDTICKFFLHTIPAFFLDGVALCFGQKPKLLKVYSRIHKFSAVLSHFTTHDIKFCNRNVRRLWQETDPQDQLVFPFSMADLNWSEYFTLYLRGIRTHIFKETDDSLKSARTKWNRLYYLHQLVKILLFCCVFYLGWILSEAIFKILITF